MSVYLGTTNLVFFYIFQAKEAKVHFCLKAKMGICPFRPKDVTKYPCSETIQQNTPILKLDFQKIEFQFDENQVIWKNSHGT